MSSTGFNTDTLNIDTGILKKDACIVLIRTEWNTAIVDQLERGCVAVLEKFGVEKILVINVPGAIEIPFAINSFWRSSKKAKRPDAFIALGCVIKGDTPHFDFVSSAVTDGVMRLNNELPVPTIFGVLTVLSEDQAMERVGGRHGHKGEEAAITAIKMIALNRSFNN